jgi:subtilisin family serine protease
MGQTQGDHGSIGPITAARAKERKGPGLWLIEAGSAQMGTAALDVPSAMEDEPANATRALEVVRLSSLMELTSGRPQIAIGLLDGPVDNDQVALKDARLSELSGRSAGCERADGIACAHGTFIAGILAASRDYPAPGICPDCTFLVRPIFRDVEGQTDRLTSATTAELAEAIVDCVRAGASVLNLSAATGQPTTRVERALQDALDFAAGRGVIVVAAAGNQGTLGTSVITRHPWVVPVAACDSEGRPMPLSNLAASLGQRGLAAPGEVTSLGINGQPIAQAGTSFATPLVTGTFALLWSLYPAAPAAALRNAVMQAGGARRRSVAPPVLDAHAAYAALAAQQEHGLVEP